MLTAYASTYRYFSLWSGLIEEPGLKKACTNSSESRGGKKKVTVNSLYSDHHIESVPIRRSRSLFNCFLF